MSVKVSVIIPSLNSINYYDECIKSVINQSLKEIEIICVDANSTDGTLELIKKYQAQDERIKLIISDKKSYGYQMNLGIAAAKGEYVGIVESDDYIDLDMYKELYALAKNKNVDILKSDIYNFYDKEKREFEYSVISYDEGFYHKDLHFESAGAVCKNTALTKQEILKNSWNMNPPGLLIRILAFGLSLLLVQVGFISIKKLIIIIGGIIWAQVAIPKKKFIVYVTNMILWRSF